MRNINTQVPQGGATKRSPPFFVFLTSNYYCKLFALTHDACDCVDPSLDRVLNSYQVAAANTDTKPTVLIKSWFFAVDHLNWDFHGVSLVYIYIYMGDVKQKYRNMLCNTTVGMPTLLPDSAGSRRKPFP